MSECKLKKIAPIGIKNGNKYYENVNINKNMGDIQEVANFYDIYEYKDVFYGFVYWCDSSCEMIAIYPNTGERVDYSPYEDEWFENCKSKEELFGHFAQDLKGLDFKIKDEK